MVPIVRPADFLSHSETEKVAVFKDKDKDKDP
jgi:hypothetical protein